MNATDISIRSMIQEDFDASALIMGGAFGSKMPMMSKCSDVEMADFMLAGGIFDENYLKGYYVAEVTDKLVGILHLDTWYDKKYKPKAKVHFAYLCSNYGFWRVVVSGLSLSFLDPKIAKDELLVDFIAIDPLYRGRGIGSRLLDHGEAIARGTEGIKRYTLSVIDENIGARRLYERKGFSVVKTEKRLLVQWLTGVAKSHKMEKIL